MYVSRFKVTLHIQDSCVRSWVNNQSGWWYDTFMSVLAICVLFLNQVDKVKPGKGRLNKRIAYNCFIIRIEQ